MMATYYILISDDCIDSREDKTEVIIEPPGIDFMPYIKAFTNVKYIKCTDPLMDQAALNSTINFTQSDIMSLGYIMSLRNRKRWATIPDNIKKWFKEHVTDPKLWHRAILQFVEKL